MLRNSIRWSAHLRQRKGERGLCHGPPLTRHCVNPGFPTSTSTPSRFSLPPFTRSYVHWERMLPEDWELPASTCPRNIKKLMRKDPTQHDFTENYWYWRIRAESTIANPETLARVNYRQLARDLGFAKIYEPSEHMVGVIELYEYLQSSPMIGPFGTVENPTLVPSIHSYRAVACTGGVGDNEHYPIWFWCREGFLYRCGECDQCYMLVRVQYEMPDGSDPFPVDEDLEDVFDYSLIESGQKLWNAGEYVQWPLGDKAYQDVYLYGGGPPDESKLLGTKKLSPEELEELKKKQMTELERGGIAAASKASSDVADQHH